MRNPGCDSQETPEGGCTGFHSPFNPHRPSSAFSWGLCSVRRTGCFLGPSTGAELRGGRARVFLLGGSGMFAEKQCLKHLGWTVPSWVQVGLGQVPTLEGSQQGQRTWLCLTVSQGSGFRLGAV